MEPNKVVTIRPIKSNKAPVKNARRISCARNDAQHRELGTCITDSCRKDFVDAEEIGLAAGNGNLRVK